jgi:hypothetical protein
LEVQSVDGRVIVKWVLNKLVRRACTGMILLKIGTTDEHGNGT